MPNVHMDLRCKVGDIVMVVGSRNPLRNGRTGVVIAAAPLAQDMCRAEEFGEVARRDWVVDLRGDPDVSFRDGRVLATNRFSYLDKMLMPLSSVIQAADVADAAELMTSEVAA